MAKKFYPAIEHGTQSWDTELATWRAILQDGPIPLYMATPGGAFANLPAANINDHGIAVYIDGTAGVLMALSDGAVWKKIGTQAATQAATSGATLGQLETAVNNLLTKMKNSGLMA